MMSSNNLGFIHVSVGTYSGVTNTEYGPGFSSAFS